MTLDFDPNVDHYKALGVDPSASAQDIKRAYRKLAKANHPDSTGGDKSKEARFKEISAAYEVLGDDKKRKQYDEIRDQLRSGAFRSGGRPGAGGPQVFDLSDLFAQFFAGQQRGGGVHVEIDDDGAGAFPFAGGGRRARRGGHAAPPEPAAPQQIRAADGTWLTVTGADVHSEVRLPFEEALLGTVREVSTIDGTAKVKIPPGTSSGQKLRLRGKGVPAHRGGEPGDHYVTVHIDVPRQLDDEGKRLLHHLVAHLKREGAGGKKRG